MDALTRGGPGGLPRPIELHAHDPLRYVGDMLAWVHQAIAAEHEFLESLFGVAAPRRMVGAVRAPHASAPAPSAAKLFWVLAALQRVGGSNPAWVLQQWARLESKFGAHDGAPSGGTWYGFALDTRLRQMLQQLETTASAMRRGARGDSTR